jgi:hypothetical protein
LADRFLANPLISVIAFTSSAPYYDHMPSYLFGPYASSQQKLLAYLTGVGFAAAIISYSFLFELQWNWWQLVLAAIISFDIPAGAVSNNFPEVKQWWQELRESGNQWQRFGANRLVCASLHLIYITAMGVAFWQNAVAFTLSMGVLLLAATFWVSRLPNHSARSGAISMVALSMVVNILFHPPSALWWFMPLLVVKVVSGFSTPAKVQ